MVTLHTQQAFVHVGVFVARDGDNLSLVDANLDMATGPAKATRRFVPLHAVVRLIRRHDGRPIRGRTSIGHSGRSGSHGGGLQKHAAISVHLVSRPSYLPQNCIVLLLAPES